MSTCFIKIIRKCSSNQNYTFFRINLEEFTQFVKNHPKLFNGLYKAFNLDIWGIEENGILKLKNLQKEKEMTGILVKQNRKNMIKLQQVYCELYGHFCFLYKNNNKSIPSQIICLDGLIVSELKDEKEQKYGFQIFHKDKVYHTKTFYCQDKKSFEEWSSKLTVYQKASITDHYNLEQKIGDGRFSVVYRGKSKKDGSYYAIKIIEKYKLSRQEKQMLSHEEEVLSLLNHSCIVKLYETIETKTHHYIVSELVNDGDLFDYIQKNKYLSEYETARILSQLFDTLQYVHSIGIVHRDLKPENVMIVLDQSKLMIKQVKIIDFGFANFLANLQETNGDSKEAICGTTNYLAPESLNTNEFTYKSDSFSMGVIFYLMLSGFLPFDSEFPEEIIKNIIDCKYEINDEFWLKISNDARDLIKKLLAKDPKDRIDMTEALNHPFILVNLNKNIKLKQSRENLPKTKVEHKNRVNMLF